MFEDQELHESIQAFRAIGAEIELEPILAFLAATRGRTARKRARSRCGCGRWQTDTSGSSFPSRIAASA